MFDKIDYVSNVMNCYAINALASPGRQWIVTLSKSPHSGGCKNFFDYLPYD